MIEVSWEIVARIVGTLFGCFVAWCSYDVFKDYVRSGDTAAIVMGLFIGALAVLIFLFTFGVVVIV